VTARGPAIVPRGEFGFINLLRGSAALAVVYSHLVGEYLDWMHQTWWLKRLVDAGLERPFAIAGHFGRLGVMVFFLISGFIITHVAHSENPLQFAIRRVFRIYPAYWLTIAIVIIFGLFEYPFDVALLHDWRSMLKLATLTNYLFYPQNIVLGVAWTLQIEVIFYALILLLIPLIRRSPSLTLALELAFVLAALLLARFDGSSWYFFAVNAGYLPYLLIGQLIYFYRSGGLTGARAMSFGAACYFIILFDLRLLHQDLLEPAQSRMLCLTMALGIFVWAMRYGNEAGMMRWPKFFANISYSLYLLHAPIGLLLLALLKPHIGYGNALLVAVVAVIATAGLVHRCLERPAIEFGRRLSNRFRERHREIVHA